MITLKQLVELGYCPCADCEAGLRQIESGFTSISYNDLILVLKKSYPKTYKRLLERSRFPIDN